MGSGPIIFGGGGGGGGGGTPPIVPEAGAGATDAAAGEAVFTASDLAILEDLSLLAVAVP